MATTTPPGTAGGKFLPFITSNSSPEFIFKSIIQRSKGYKTKSLSIVYGAILGVGIEQVKSYVSTLPTNLNSKAIMDRVVSNFPQYAITNGEIAFWKAVCQIYGVENFNLSSKYTLEELATMIAVMNIHSPQSIKELSFTWELPVDIHKANFDCEVKSYESFIQFNSKGDRIGFSSFNELKAFCYARSVKPDSDLISIHPVLVAMSEGEYLDEAHKRLNCAPFAVLEEKWSAPQPVKEEDSDDLPF